MTDCISVLIVEDHRIVADGLGLILGSQPDIDVVAYARTAPEAVAAFRLTDPDVTLMDMRLGSTSGLDAIKAIRHHKPTARIVVLSMYRGTEDVQAALKAGAMMYVLKETIADDLIRVVREVYAGRRPDSEFVATSMASSPPSPAPLTPRERQVLQLVANGLRNRDIGVELGVTDETVEVHLRHIYGKLEVGNRTAAVKAGLLRGAIHLE